MAVMGTRVKESQLDVNSAETTKAEGLIPYLCKRVWPASAYETQAHGFLLNGVCYAM